MHEDIEKILIPADAIHRRVQELGRQISADYQGQEVTLIGVLRGASVFLADLLRAVTIGTRVDFMAISSYQDATQSSGVVRITKDLDDSIEGRATVVVEDIIDTGLTLHYLRENLSTRGPASLRVCALLDKPARRVVPEAPEYVGFAIPDEFVVGYGLDYAQRYRNLPYVGTLKPEVYHDAEPS